MMKQPFKKRRLSSGKKSVLMTVSVMALAGTAWGASLGDVANNATSSIRSIISGLEYVCLLFSGIFGIGGLLKAHQHYNQPHSVKSSTILAMLVVAGCFGAFTYFLEMGSGTLFGSGANRGTRISHR